MNSRAAYLLGVGTAVCGSSAILATSPVSDAEAEDVMVTVGVVNLVKLTRVTLLAPVAVLTALVVSRRQPGHGHKGHARLPLWRYVPWFVWGFIAIAAVRTTGWLPTLEFAPPGREMVRLQLSGALPYAAKWLLAGSMAAIGLQAHLRPMLRAGARAMAAGTAAWLVMAVAAWLLLRLVL